MQIKNLAVNLSDERPLIKIVAQHLKISPKKIADIKIIRKAIDARQRKGSEIKFIYSIEVKLYNETNQKIIKPQIFLPPTHLEKYSA